MGEDCRRRQAANEKDEEEERLRNSETSERLSDSGNECIEGEQPTRDPENDNRGRDD